MAINRNHPQSKALAIGNYGCLAMCYLYCAGIAPDEEKYLCLVLASMNEGLLDGDCTVLDAEKYLKFFTGKKYRVEKKVCVSIKDIKNKTPVRYYYNGNYHWVVVENGEIVFNPLLNSVCVNKGKPDTMRVITKL